MIKRIALAAALFYLSVSATVLAAEGTGTLDGQLVNNTAEGGSVADQEITLTIYENGVESASNTTTTDAEGRFIFNNLSTSLERNYEVTLIYQGAEYFSEFFSFSENETTISLEMDVWDSTEARDAIQVVTAHTIIYTAPNVLQVTEYYLYSNDSDKTFIGPDFERGEGGKRTLDFTLPVGITDFQPTMGLFECCVFRTEEGFIDTMPFLPGLKEISFQYTVATESSDFIIPQRSNFPILKYDLLVEGADVKVSVDQLEAKDQMNNDGIIYNHFSGANLAPDDTLLIKLAGLPQTSNDINLLWVIFSVVLLGGGAVLVYSLRKRNAPPVLAETGSQPGKNDLLAQLAQLDDDFENSVIQEKTYRSQRNILKTQLLKLMDEADGGKGGS